MTARPPEAQCPELCQKPWSAVHRKLAVCAALDFLDEPDVCALTGRCPRDVALEVLLQRLELERGAEGNDIVIEDDGSAVLRGEKSAGKPSCFQGNTWTDDHILDLIRWHESGLSAPEIARKTGRSTNAIHKKLKKLKAEGVFDAE